jgi:hypothetical protein
MTAKWTGIEQAAADVNSSYRLVWRVYGNFKTGKVWAHEYVSESDYTVFDDPDIFFVGEFDNLGRRGDISAERLEELVERAAYETTEGLRAMEQMRS